MSMFQHDGGLSMAATTAGDMSILDADVSLVNDLSIDMSLPMDLDVDISQAANAGPTAFLQQQSGLDLDKSFIASGANDGPFFFGGANTNQQDAQMTGAGAGPLPTGFGMAPQPSSSSTLTEFTKRRNWSQRIIEELKDFLHILTPDGRILYVSPSCKNITGHESSALVGKFIGEFVHPDDSGIFMREFNESIASGHALRFFYRFKKEDGTYMIFECDGHPHISAEPTGAASSFQGQEAPVAMTGICRGFFMMARPYPTKNAALLDSFLEHKIENERLMRRIEELKREEAEENAEQDRIYRDHVTSHTGATPSETQLAQSQLLDNRSEITTSPNYESMPPPAKPSISNTALTRQNLDSALSATKPDSIADKMSRYEASSNHLESIELLTGLQYRDGERSHGISTGDTSPALIRGDAGIAILLDRDRDGSKKEKKKQKVADEYVCADCGTLDSPEWRKGPKGPKTLCNACGLRWAKKEKKRGGGVDEGKNSSPTHAAHSHSLSANMGGMMSIPPGLNMHSSTGSS